MHCKCLFTILPLWSFSNSRQKKSLIRKRNIISLLTHDSCMLVKRNQNIFRHRQVGKNEIESHSLYWFLFSRYSLIHISWYFMAWDCSHADRRTPFIHSHCKNSVYVPRLKQPWGHLSCIAKRLLSKTFDCDVRKTLINMLVNLWRS
jgi:hypothetical protein